VIDLKTALAYSLAVGGAVLLCRALPFLIIRSPKEGRPKADDRHEPRAGEPAGGGDKAAANGSGTPRREGRGGAAGGFLSLIEQVIPPVVMTVLACNSIAMPVKENPRAALPVLSAAALSLAAQLWKGSFLLSILGGTALYMLLTRLLPA
jgi:branched-subunit amino acid transport protein AzlD